jgi:CBS domain-containing protein
MKVQDVMTPNPVSCEAACNLRMVATVMLANDCSAVPILRSGEVLGIVTDRDIACRAVARGWNAPEVPAAAVMSAQLVAIHPDEPVEEAARLMKENQIHHLPVIDSEGALVGIVAQSDLGRRMSDNEFGQMARMTSIRGGKDGRQPRPIVVRAPVAT